MKDHRIRIGIVGLGFGSYGLIPAFRADSRCEVAALCGAHPEKVTTAAERWQVPRTFTDPLALVADDGIDAVAIATPPDVQERVADAALRAGKPVFAEKPLGIGAEQGDALASLAKSSGIPTAVDFMFPELQTWSTAKEMLLGGAIGGVRHANVCYQFESYDHARGLVQWKTDPQRGGGALSHFASHVFYNLEWFLGGINSMTCTLARSDASVVPGDSHVTCALSFASGVSCSVVVMSAAPFGTGHRIEFFGDGGCLALVSQGGNPVSFTLLHGRRGDEGLAEVPVTEPPAPGDDPRTGPCSRLAARFLDGIRERRDVVPGFAAGARVQRLIEAARESSAGGVAVDIPMD